jgi:hypothetical protein
MVPEGGLASFGLLASSNPSPPLPGMGMAHGIAQSFEPLFAFAMALHLKCHL